MNAFQMTAAAFHDFECVSIREEIKRHWDNKILRSEAELRHRNRLREAYPEIHAIAHRQKQSDLEKVFS